MAYDSEAKSLVGSRFKKVRKEFAPTIQKLVDYLEKNGLKVSTSVISRLDRGILPKTETLNQLGEILSFSVDWLKTGKGQRSDNVIKHDPRTFDFPF